MHISRRTAVIATTYLASQADALPALAKPSYSVVNVAGASQTPTTIVEITTQSAVSIETQTATQVFDSTVTSNATPVTVTIDSSPSPTTSCTSTTGWSAPWPTTWSPWDGPPPYGPPQSWPTTTTSSEPCSEAAPTSTSTTTSSETCTDEITTATTTSSSSTLSSTLSSITPVAAASTSSGVQVVYSASTWVYASGQWANSYAAKSSPTAVASGAIGATGWGTGYAFPTGGYFPRWVAPSGYGSPSGSYYAGGAAPTGYGAWPTGWGGPAPTGGSCSYAK